MEDECEFVHIDYLSYEPDDLSYERDNHSQNEKKRGYGRNPAKKNRKTNNHLKDEKRQLAELVKDEEIIYNLQHKLHSNSTALSAAWQRVATKMSKSVPECKALYKSLRDAARYRQKKIAGKSGDSGDEISLDGSCNSENDYLAFLTSTSTKFPRKTMVLGGADTECEKTDASVYSFASKKKKKEPDMMETSLVEMTQAFSSYVKEMHLTSPAEQPTLKFLYIWQNLDHLFQQISQQDVNELNLSFIQQTCEKLRGKHDNVEC